MLEPENQDEMVIIDPHGIIHFPETIMSEYVVATPGCTLWYNEKTSCLGVRLLRGLDNPPYLIQRIPGTGTVPCGLLDVGPFLAKVGIKLSASVREYPCRFFRKYHMLEISLGAKPERPEIKKYLDDFPAIED